MPKASVTTPPPDEVAILQQLGKLYSMRHSLTPPVSDFKSDATPEEIYSVLSQFRVMGMVDDNHPNPSAETDGVKMRWHLNFLGLLYLQKRGDGLSHEHAFTTVTGRQALPLQSSKTPS